MASKKTGRAAGLAALAGLAYMAREKGMFGGKDKGDKSAPDRDDADRYMGSRASVKSSSGDFMSEKEPGWDTKTGSGDLMSEKEPGWDTKSSPASVARTPSATRTAPTKAPSNLTSAASGVGIPGENAPSWRVGSTPDRAPGGAGKRGGVGDGGKSMVDRQNAAVARANRSMTPAGGKPMTVDEYYESGKAQIDKDEGTFKRGGKVKKMASGGITSSASSASRRGDGIASKGKTRCKMY